MARTSHSPSNRLPRPTAVAVTSNSPARSPSHSKENSFLFSPHLTSDHRQEINLFSQGCSASVDKHNRKPHSSFSSNLTYAK